MPEQSGGSPDPAPSANPSSPNDDGNNPRRSRQRRRRRNPANAQVQHKFKGKVEALAENVFDVNPRDADAFNTNLKEIGEYIARTVTNGGDFIKALDPDDLGFDVNSQPPDPPANASAVAMEKWKIEYKNWDTKEQRRTEASKSAYAIVLGQCSEALIERMDTYTRFKAIKNQIDVIGLAGLIREAMYSGTGAKKPTISFLEAESNLIEFKQSSRMTTARYLETFKSKVEIFEHLGGEPGCAKARVDAQLRTNGHDPDTATDRQRTEATSQARDEYLGNLFIMNSDPNRFVDLFADLRNGRARSKDSSDDYPSTLVKAYDVLMTYEETSLLRRKYGQTSHYETGMSFATDGGRGGRGRGNYGRGGRGRSGRGGRGNQAPADGDEDQTNAITETDAPEDGNGGNSGIFEADNTGSSDNNSNSPPKQYTDQCYSIRRAQRQPGSMFTTLLLDSASTSNIIANKEYLSHIFKVEYPLTVNSLGGTKEIPHMGYMGEYPEPVWYHPDGGVNILSLNSVQRYYKCTMDTTKQNSIDVHMTNGHIMSFHASGKGLYRYELEPNESITDLWTLVTMNPDLQDSIYEIDTVAARADSYTRRDYERAIRARKLQNIIMRPGSRKYKDICLRHLRRNPVTRADANAADDIFGTNLGSLKGKTVRRPNPHVPTGLDPVPARILHIHKNVTLAIDIMFVNKIPFLVTVSRNLKFGTVEPLPNRRQSTIVPRLRSVLRLYRHRGFHITTILADHEFEPLRADFPSLNTCGADEHVPDIERYIRTIKDSTRSTYRMLPYTRVPRLVLIHLVKNAVFWLNAFPSRDGVSSEHSPRYLMTGFELSYDRHAVMEFGQYVQTHEEHTNDMRQRTLGAICLGPTGNRQGGHWFMSLTSGARITRHRWTILPAPQDAINRVNAIGLRQNMPSTITYADRYGREVEDSLDALEYDTDADSSYHPDSDDESSSSDTTSGSSESDTSSDSDSTYSGHTDASSDSADDPPEDPPPDVPLPDHLALVDPVPHAPPRALLRRPRRTTGVDPEPRPPEEMGPAARTTGVGQAEMGQTGRSTRRVQIDPDATTGVGADDSSTTTGVGDNDSDPTHRDNDSDTTTEMNEENEENENDAVVTGNNPPLERAPEEEIIFEYPTDSSDTEDSTQSTPVTIHQQIQDAEQIGREMAQNDGITLPPRASRGRQNKQNDYVYFSDASCAAEHTFNYLIESIADLSPGQIFAVLMEPDVNSMWALLTEQMSAKKGLRHFGQKGADAIKKELEQLVYRRVMHGKQAHELSREQKRAALRYLMFLKQKRCGRIKGRGCADGRKQRIYKTKEDTSLPTIHIESLFLSAIIDALERRCVATMDIPGAFMQANIDEIIHVKLVGELADLLIRVDPSYEQFVTVEKGQRVIYTELDKALYGTLQAALLFWKKLTKFLSEELGFMANPYDSCVMNKTVNGKQMTIGWHVDDLKLSHVEAVEVEKMITLLNKEFGKEAPLTVTRGKIHEYLGMTIDYSEDGKVKFSMFDYVDRLLSEIPEDLSKGSCASSASNHLFNVNENAEKLDPATAILYHHLTAQLLYLGKRTRPDLLTAVSFLCTRVQAPDIDDWKKLGRCLRFLRDTKDDPFTLEADGMTKIFWWIDASFAVHDNMRSHTGATMSMGRGCPINISTKQKINTRSSTEAEVVGVNDAMYLVTWVRHFLEAQGYEITDNIIYQDNQSAMLLERNGRRSSTKNTRHMEIRYFFITDHVDRGKVSIEYCPTDDMLADFFTKPTQGSKYRNFRRRILNLPSDPSTISQECVGAARSGKQGDSSSGIDVRMTGNANDDDVIPPSHSRPKMRYVAGSYLAAAKGLLNGARRLNNVHRSHSIQQTVLAVA